MSSMSSQRNTGQMMPTPGFVNSSTNNNSNNGQSYLSVEASNNSGGFSAAPMMVPQTQQQQQQQHQQQLRQDIGGQNSRMLQNHGSQMGVGLRSGMQQKMSNVSNSSINGGVGMNAKSVDSGTSYTNPTRNSQQAYDNLQRSGMQGKVFISHPFSACLVSYGL